MEDYDFNNSPPPLPPTLTSHTLDLRNTAPYMQPAFPYIPPFNPTIQSDYHLLGSRVQVLEDKMNKIVQMQASMAETLKFVASAVSAGCGTTCTLNSPILNSSFQSPKQPLKPSLPPLPPIPNDLKTPVQVLAKFPKLRGVTKVGQLSVKLAREAFFGTDIMRHCTVYGCGSCHPLPHKELLELKAVIKDVFKFTHTEEEFELLWKNSCEAAIGHACSSLRREKPIKFVVLD